MATIRISSKSQRISRKRDGVTKRSARPLDIVIKTKRRDFATYLRLQKDITKHSGLQGKVYVIVPEREIRYFRRASASDFVLVSSEEVLKLSGYHLALRDTWSTQQVLKLAARQVVANEQYLVLDANTLISFDFDETFFWRKNGYIYGVGDFSDVAWELQSRNFLRLSGPGRLYGFRAVNQIFIRSNVGKLFAHLENLYRDHAVPSLLRYSDTLSAEYWTEYALYGVFCRCVLPEPEHCFQKRKDLLSFSFKTEFDRFLLQVQREHPLMIKFYKRRPSYQVSDTAYAKYVSRIKAAYRA
jgi:hypothetical protein